MLAAIAGSSVDRSVGVARRGVRSDGPAVRRVSGRNSSYPTLGCPLSLSVPHHNTVMACRQPIPIRKHLAVRL